MVTSSLECLTPKSHFLIDCLGPPWLRSWQTLALWWVLGIRGVEQCGSWRYNCSRMLRQLETPPRPQPPSSQPLGHEASPTAVCSLLIIVFLHELKPQVEHILYTRFLYAPVQLLRHTITCIQWGEPCKNTFALSSFHQALLRSNYTVSLISRCQAI